MPRITVSFEVTLKEAASLLTILEHPTPEEVEALNKLLKGTPAGAAAAPPRKRAAANGAPAHTKKDDPRPPGSLDPLDVSGGEEAVEDDDDLLGVSQPSISAEEAWEKGLGMLREAMARDKDKCRPLIRAVQKQFGTTKLGEVPPAKGYEVLKAAVEVAEKMGMAV